MWSYFVENPIYPKRCFCRWFWMGVKLFEHIAEDEKLHDRFFEQRRNCSRGLGHRTYQKVTATLRMMACGTPADLVDDNVAVGGTKSIKCVKMLCKSGVASVW
jgi:hypothetical protein